MLNLSMGRVWQFLYWTAVYRGKAITYFDPIVNEAMRNISLPAEAIYWQELGDGRILTVWKLPWYVNYCFPIEQCDFNSFNFAITSCNANNLVSKVSARLEKKKKRKHIQLLTLLWFVFVTAVPHNKNK